MKTIALVRLVFAQARGHRVRTTITLLAIAIAIAFVGFSVRGLQATRQEMIDAARQFGRFDAIVMPKDFGATQLDAKLIADLRADPAIAELAMAVRTRVRVLKPELPPMPGPFGGAMAMGTSADKPPQAMADGRWVNQAPTMREAVITTGFQERAKLRISDQLTIAGNGAEVTLTVVGTIKTKPMVPGVRMMPSMHLADVMLSQAAADELNGYADRPGMLGIVLKDPATAGAFAKAWRDKVAATDPPARIRSTQDEFEDPMGGPSSGMSQLLFATSTLGAFLAAGFIIFLSLSIGVRSRMRQYAILRTLALSHWQLVAMVVGEALVNALAGLVLGLVVLSGGLVLCRSLAANVPAFAGGAFADTPLGGMTVGIAAGCALIGALAAAILPAWQVFRIRPLDILGGQGQSARIGFPWVMTGIGLLLIAVNPILILLGDHESMRQVLAFFQGGRGFGAPLLGSLLMIVGFALITPLVVWLVERLLHPPMAVALRLDARFLRQQLTGNLWRAVGTTVALSTGLSLYVTSLVWGFSMLKPFTPDGSLPRMQVAILPAGLPDEAIPELYAVPGVLAERLLPMAIEQPRLSATTLTRPGFAHVDEQQRHVLVMGIAPERAFGGKNPMFHLDFIAGDAASAAAGLAKDHGCVIPDHFATQCGLKLGDTFTVEVPEGAGPDVTYTVVGITQIPGWNWLTKFSESRRRAVRALALVFVDHDQARKDYALERAGYFWLDPEGDPPAPEAAKELAMLIEPIGRKYSRVNLNVPRAGRTAVGTQYVNITDREDVKERLLKRANDVIWGLTWMPIITLVITSLAVFNTILTSIRARYWQFGILRGIGMTRSQLVRLILGESLLLWLVASALSLASGIALAWCGTRLCTLFFFFAGRTPPLELPWAGLGLGFLIALVLCLVAGLIPALAASRTEPLRFIQGGCLST